MSIDSARKHNIRIFPIYKMFSWDLLFYYSIIFLFLTQAKHLTASQVLFADAFYPIFKVVTQLICTSFSLKCGKSKSIIIGNIFVSISILLVILGKSVENLIFSNLFSAIGFNLKSLCETSILYDSLSDSPHKRDHFSKIDGKGLSRYYIVDAISAFSTGFLFVFNPYLPMILCFVSCLIATLISLGFQMPSEKIETIKSTTEKISFRHKFKNFKKVFKFITHSKRLRSLLLFSGIFAATLTVFRTLMNSLFVDLNFPNQLFGFIFAFIQVISAIASGNQTYFHKKFKNRTLTFFCLPLVCTMLLTGLVVVCNINYYIILIVTFMMVLSYAVSKGPFYSLIKRYLNSFSNPNLNTKIYAANAIVDSICQSTFNLIGSYLLSITSTAYSLIILGGSLIIVFICILEYMKTRLGLKPEEYEKSDIEFV